MPKKTSRQPARRSTKSGMSPIIQFGVVFVIVAAMVLLMYAAKRTP